MLSAIGNRVRTMIVNVIVDLFKDMRAAGHRVKATSARHRFLLTIRTLCLPQRSLTDTRSSRVLSVMRDLFLDERHRA